jgi:hypothetical protein
VIAGVYLGSIRISKRVRLYTSYYNDVDITRILLFLSWLQIAMRGEAKFPASLAQGEESNMITG